MREELATSAVILWRLADGVRPHGDGVARLRRAARSRWPRVSQSGARHAGREANKSTRNCSSTTSCCATSTRNCDRCCGPRPISRARKSVFMPVRKSPDPPGAPRREGTERPSLHSTDRCGIAESRHLVMWRGPAAFASSFGAPGRPRPTDSDDRTRAHAGNASGARARFCIAASAHCAASFVDTQAASSTGLSTAGPSRWAS